LTVARAAEAAGDLGDRQLLSLPVVAGEGGRAPALGDAIAVRAVGGCGHGFR
jgi:hypothetical protein